MDYISQIQHIHKTKRAQRLKKARDICEVIDKEGNYLKAVVRFALIPFIMMAFLFIHPQIFLALVVLIILMLIFLRNRSSLNWRQGISIFLLMTFAFSIVNFPVSPLLLASTPQPDAGVNQPGVHQATAFSGTVTLSDVSDDSLRIGKDIYSSNTRFFDLVHLLASLKYGGNKAYIKKNGKWFNVLTLGDNDIGQIENAEKDYTVNGWSLRYWYKTDIEIGEIVDNDPPSLIGAVQNVRADIFILQFNEKVKYPDSSIVVQMVKNDDNTLMTGTIEGFVAENQTSLLIKTQHSLSEGIWTVRLESISDQAGNISALQLCNLVVEEYVPGIPVLSLNEQDGQTVLSWDSIPGATAYAIKRGESETQLIEIDTVADTSFTDTTGNPDVPYYYAVSSFVDGLESANSNILRKVVIHVDEVDENNMYKTTSDTIVLTGSVLGVNDISTIKCTYQSVLAEQATEIPVSGTINWTISNLPLEIGTTRVVMTVNTTSSKEYNKTISINRVNEFIEFSENVMALVPDDEEDLNTINGIAQSIINFSQDDMGTTDDLTDDQTVILVREECPLVVDLKQNQISVGDIVSIPPCEEFLAGLTFKILEYGEPSDFINYPPQDYELLYVCTPGLADLFQGDISMDFSGYIDSEDPIAFSMFPEGVEIYAEDETGNQTLLVEDASNSTDSQVRSLLQTNSPGMQWGELKRMILPSVNLNTGNSCDILVKFGNSDGVVVYDKDGNLENTKNDQVTVKGETGIKNLRTLAGVEWHPNFNPFSLDLLPQQVICKTTYDKTLSLSAEFSKGLSLTNVTRTANKALNAGFENKYKFLGMDITGIDFKDCIVLGAFGIRLDMPPTYATLGVHQTTSKLVGLSPILLVMPVIDITGKLEAKLTLAYSYNSYVESGSNIQKVGYTGSYGTLEANRGQKSVSLPFDRQLEIYDLEAKSSTNKNEKPAPSLEVGCSGTAEASFGAGIMTGLMLNGIVPAAIKGVAYSRAKASLDGSAKWENGSGPTFEGSGQVGVDVGVRMNIFAKLSVETALGSPGFDYTHEWEYHFIDYTLSSISLKGKVRVADGDFDGTNNPTLTGVTVTATKKYVQKSTGSYGSNR